MKSFGLYLQRAQVPDWKEHYIDYCSLKESLQLFGKRRRQLQRGELEWSKVIPEKPSDIDMDDDNNIVFAYALEDFGQDEAGCGCGGFTTLTKEERLSKREHDDFQRMLQSQLDAASHFFQKRWMDLQSMHFDTDEKKEEDSILDLYGFAVVNICVLRNSILKYNAHVRMYDGNMYISEYEILNGQPAPSVLPTTMLPPDAEVESLGSNEVSTDFSMRTVVPSLMDALDPLQERMVTMPSYWIVSDSPELAGVRSGAASDFKSRADELESLLEQTSWKQQSRQSANRRERLLNTIRSLFMMGTSHVGISLEPKFLYTQIRGFKKEMRSLALWRERPEAEDDEKGIIAIGEMDPANVWPLVLNLVSCYLFMMNNYIIEPSSAYYANALGSSDALSGIMMGMAPWFAMTSAVGYSIWTNKSYKQPILFAGTLMVVGNTLYGSAYSYASMPMCLIGRAITGFGAPRIINRRYVADATPFSLRTMSSAAFALTTALGAASGPGFAILLDMVPVFQFPIPGLGLQTFNGMTGPGFVMAFLWFLFTITILVSFGEPNRSGIEELKQREAKKQEEKVADAELTNFREALKSCATDEDFDFDDSSSSGDISTGYQKDGFDDEYGGRSKHSCVYCWRHMTRATALCMALIFMKRIALESVVGSTSVITKNRYEWSIRNVGTLHLVNGIIVIPVSVFAGWLSQFHEDRYLAMWFMSITAVGLLIMIDPTDFVDVDTYETYNYDKPFAVSQVQYILGSLVAFSGVEACESFVASLMSKCVPSALAVGTFNSGLLATLVGTGGRATGDLFITAMGLISIRNLLNLLIIPGFCLTLLSMFLLWKNYKTVAV